MKSRRDFLGVTAGAMGVWAVGASAWVLIDTMNPAADTIANSIVDFDLQDIKPGERVVKVFFGMPLFIYRRTPAELKEIRAEGWRNLRDPQSDEERVKKGHDEWLAVFGVCTRCGCVLHDAKHDSSSWSYGGWFCPCYGCRYDRSGRIRYGLARKNLRVPEYKFVTDTLIRMYRSPSINTVVEKS